jgi:two-component system, cell cycle sensor histidine kinase and response regulator CckA
MSAEESLPSPGPTPPEAPRQETFILLVDDDAHILESVGALISRLGYTPVLAASGEEALALLEVGLEPALVILDMDMPGLGGARTLPWIRALRPDLPVVISTGGNHPRVTELIQTYPRISLLPKPYGLRELKERLG